MTKAGSDATRKIDAYIDSLPAFSKKICTRLRTITRRAAPDLAEDWKWGSPCFSGRSIVCGFAAFKKHVTFDFWNGALLDDVHGILNHGEGNARGRGVKLHEGDPIPEKALAECVKQAARLDAEGAKAPAKKRSAKKIAVPEALAIPLALKKNTRAREFFESLPPSCRREYCEWVASAKREETVKRRIQKALEQLGRGERMNEKYRK